MNINFRSLSNDSKQKHKAYSLHTDREKNQNTRICQGIMKCAIFWRLEYEECVSDELDVGSRNETETNTLDAASHK